MGEQVHPEDRPRHYGPGLHRDPRPSFGLIGLAVLVALLLGGLGAGAAFLPQSFLGGNDQAGQGGSAGAGTTLAGAEGAGEWPAADANPAGTPPTPAPKATPSKTAKPKPSPTKTAAKPRRTSTGTPTTGTGTGDPATLSELEKVVAIVNRERAGGGCPAVKMNTKLNRAAQLHSEDQAEHDRMSHEGSDGSTPWQRSERAGYKNAIGENVAMGYRDAEAVMDGWMNSPGHRNNIMNCSARAIGMGLARSDDGSPYWTQMFGSVA
jgi:uncharacterized protein YkwD